MREDPPRPPVESHGRAYYRIRLAGRIDQSWSDRLGGMEIAAEDANPDGEAVSVVSGSLPDQAALTGVLNSVYDLGLAIISVERDGAVDNSR